VGTLAKGRLMMLGIPLISVANVDALAATCAEPSHYSFLLTIAPPRTPCLTGIPVKPVAIF
jgi:hypothetical protein